MSNIIFTETVNIGTVVQNLNIKNKVSLYKDKINRKLVLGTTQFGISNYGVSNFTNHISKKNSYRILEHAWKNHIRTLDTAPVYGSEEIIGDFLKFNGISTKAKIITKLPTLRYKKNYLDFAKRSIETSLKKLSIKKMFCLLIHDPKDLNFLNNKINFFEKIKKTFDIENIGFSIYEKKEFKKGLKIFSQAAFQFPENLIVNNVVDFKRKNLFFARSIFLQGFLLNEKIHKERVPKSLILPHKKMHSFFKNNNINPIELCLNYLFSNKRIDYYLFGVDNIKHLEKIVNIKTSKKIDKKTIKFIQSLFSKKINIKNWK